MALAQKIFYYMAKSQEIFLLFIMLDPEWITRFATTPLFHMALPFQSALILLQLALGVYTFIKTPDKNSSHHLDLIISAACAVLTSISFNGIGFSFFLDFSFAIAPWFFIGSLAISLAYQISLIGWHLYQASHSSMHERLSSLRAAIHHLLLSAAITSFLMATLASFIISALAPYSLFFVVPALAFIVLDLFWRVVLPVWQPRFLTFIGLLKESTTEHILPHDQLFSVVPVSIPEDINEAPPAYFPSPLNSSVAQTATLPLAVGPVFTYER